MVSIMKIKSFLWAALLIVSLTGCHKITFVQPDVTPQRKVTSQYHYNVVFNLIETSDPVRMSDCNGVWRDVKTFNSFASAILGSLDSALLGLDIVSMMEVKYRCAEPGKDSAN